MPFHVRISPKSRKHDEVSLDVGEADLEARFLRPYREGRAIVVAGKTIPPEDLERIRISYTTERAAQLLPGVRARRRDGTYVIGLSDEWYLAHWATDVTDQFITAPPGAAGAPERQEAEVAVPDPRVVFVVHGRNDDARRALFNFLRSIGLHPMEWSEAVEATGQPTPYIGEILAKAFAVAQAVVVLFTPDDEGHLLPAHQKRDDPAWERDLTPQARLNVVFEAGMAMGRDPNRTVLVEVGQTRPFSDIAGRHTLRLDNSTQRRQELAQRLGSAGCPVRLTGTDWHTAGSFPDG